MRHTHADVLRALEEVMKRLEVYNDHLKDHMARTSLLEASLEAQRKHFEYRHEESEERSARLETSISDRISKQEAQLNGLPAKAVHYIAIVSGAIALFKALF